MGGKAAIEWSPPVSRTWLARFTRWRLSMLIFGKCGGETGGPRRGEGEGA